MPELRFRRGGQGRRLRPALLTLLTLLVPAAVVGALLAPGTLEEIERFVTSSRSLSQGPTRDVARGATPSGEGRRGMTFETADVLRPKFRKMPRAGLVFDLTSGEVLWRRKPLERAPIASLTKIMTALLVVDRTGVRETVRISPEALHYRGSAVGLPQGRRVSEDTLLHGLLLASGNDAAIALADHVAGDQRRFVRLMNRRASDLGLGCTRFVSPDGYADGNRSCAADLAVLARLAMARPRIARVTRKARAVLPFPVKGGKLHVNSTNPLLKTHYPGAIGLKTGFTDPAGRCLVAVAQRGRRRLGVVLLDSPDPGRQARELLDAAFKVRR